MLTVNEVTIMGFSGNKPELKQLGNGNSVINLSVATQEKWKGKDGNPGERTDWHKVTAFGKLAEIAAEYVDKGSIVYVKGKLQTKEWQDKQGNKRSNLEIMASNIIVVGSNQKSKDNPNQLNLSQQTEEDDDIPF